MSSMTSALAVLVWSASFVSMTAGTILDDTPVVDISELQPSVVRQSLSGHSSRNGIVYLSVMCGLSLFLLGCVASMYCSCSCSCRRSAQTESLPGLDAYAPRSQSIVWPPLPAETARVLEVTFLHTPEAVDCICRNCITSCQQTTRAIQHGLFQENFTIAMEC